MDTQEKWPGFETIGETSFPTPDYNCENFNLKLFESDRIIARISELILYKYVELLYNLFDIAVLLLALSDLFSKPRNYLFKS